MSDYLCDLLAGRCGGRLATADDYEHAFSLLADQRTMAAERGMESVEASLTVLGIALACVARRAGLAPDVPAVRRRRMSAIVSTS